jgi:sulfatase modifying factor 1
MRKPAFLLCLLLIQSLIVQGQYRYTADSVISYWPNGKKKECNHNFFSQNTDYKFSYNLEYHNNGILKKKEIIHIPNLRGDNIVIDGSYWNNKGSLQKRYIYINGTEYSWDSGNNSVYINVHYPSYNLKVTYNKDEIQKIKLKDFVKIPSGEFEDFSSPYPVCPKVFINEFYLQETEVTNKQFQEFINVMLKDSAEVLGVDYIKQYLCPDTLNVADVIVSGKKIKISKYLYDPAFQNYPITLVNWWAAKYYCEWYQQKLELEYPSLKGIIKVRLPTELEWEYAASEGKGMKEYIAKEKEYILTNSTLNSPFSTESKSYKPNKFGLYDMIGNMKERCEDAYFDTDLKNKDSLFLYDPFEWNIFRCYYNDEEPRKVVSGGSFNNTYDYIEKGARGFSFQDSTRYFDENYFKVDKEFSNGEYSKSYKLNKYYEKLPPDVGFRVVIELFDPNSIRKYPICIPALREF